MGMRRRYPRKTKKTATMFEKDYILRLLQQFFEDLSLFLSKKKKEEEEHEKQEDYDWASLYDTYVGDYSFYHTAQWEEILASFSKYSPSERLHRMEMLAELYFREAQLERDSAVKLSLLERSLLLWEYINKYSDTYSMERVRRMEYIRGVIGGGSEELLAGETL